MSKAARARRRTAESWREFGKAEGRASMQADLEAAREVGREQARAQNGAAIEQLRADAQALETSAKLLRDAPGFPVPHKAETIVALFAMAAGIRLAADRIPDALDLPF